MNLWLLCIQLGRTAWRWFHECQTTEWTRIDGERNFIFFDWGLWNISQVLRTLANWEKAIRILLPFLRCCCFFFLSDVLRCKIWFVTVSARWVESIDRAKLIRTSKTQNGYENVLSWRLRRKLIDIYMEVRRYRWWSYTVCNIKRSHKRNRINTSFT